MELLEVIESHISFSDAYLQHPNLKDLEEIIIELQKEDLDLRRLVSTKNDGYKSKGKDWLDNEWQKSLAVYEHNFPLLQNEKNQIIKQKNGICRYQEVPTQASL